MTRKHVPLLPELPYRLPDGTVVRAIEDIEVGASRAAAHLQVLARYGEERNRAEIGMYRWALADLTLLLRVQGQKYEKRQAHSLLARAAEAMAGNEDHGHAALVVEIETYLRPRLARHPEALPHGDDNPGTLFRVEPRSSGLALIAPCGSIVTTYAIADRALAEGDARRLNGHGSGSGRSPRGPS
jgi:hypothetical protein